MLLLNPGYTKTVNLAANQTLYVETLGLVVVTAVSGLGITAGVLASVDGSQTFGPYATDGVLTIAATKSDCTYGVSDADNLARVVTNPSAGGIALVGPDGPLALSGYHPDFNVDCIVSGMALPTTGGLANSITAGVAYITGYRRAFVGTNITLTPSSDNYIDAKPDGTYAVLPVANGAGAPAVTVNALRMGYVVTGASTVSSAVVTGKDSLGNWMGNRVSKATCILGGLTSQAITGNTNTQITFGTTALEIFDNQGVHRTSSNTHRIPILQTGLYALEAFLSHGTGGSSPQLLTIRKNADVSVPLYTSNSGTATSQCSRVGGMAYLVAGDFIYMRFNSFTAVSLVEAYFSAVKVG